MMNWYRRRPELDLPAVCPRCGSKRTVRGRVSGGNVQLNFNAAGLRWATFRFLYFPTPDARACTACGLAWLALPPEDLRAQMRDYGKPATRAWLAGAADAPLPDA